MLAILPRCGEPAESFMPAPGTRYHTMARHMMLRMIPNIHFWVLPPFCRNLIIHSLHVSDPLATFRLVIPSAAGTACSPRPSASRVQGELLGLRHLPQQLFQPACFAGNLP